MKIKELMEEPNCNNCRYGIIDVCSTYRECDADYSGWIPKEEPKKSCDTCWREDDPVCVKCSKATMSLWTPKEEKPATKRVAVIWFGEVPVDKCENPIISDEMTGYVYDQVELIDPDRLRYGVPEKGDVICDVRGTKLRSTTLAYEPGAFRLIIDPPTPEPETVEQVIQEMFDHFKVMGYENKDSEHKCFNADIDYFISKLSTIKERSEP